MLSAAAIVLPQPAAVAEPAVPAAALPGWLDQTYGVDGLGGEIPTGEHVPLSWPATVDNAGRALIVTSDGAPFPGTVHTLRRLTASGDVDTTFGGGALLLPPPSSISAIHVDEGGAVLVGGALPPALTRYTNAGEVDTAFGDGGTLTLSGVHHHVDKIMAGIRHLVVFAFEGGGHNPYLAAVTPAGDLDPTFAPNASTPGILPLPSGAIDAAVDGDGVAVLIRPDPQALDFELIRYNAVGAPDSSYGAGGAVALPQLWARGVDGHDGALYVYGEHLQGGVTNHGSMAVTKVLAGGQIDPAFGVDGKAQTHLDYSAAPSADSVTFGSDVIYLTTRRENLDGQATVVARFTMSGALDGAFGYGGELTLDSAGGDAPKAFALGTQPDGRLLMGYETPGGGPTGVVRLVPQPRAEPGGFVPLAPARLLDTRTGTGAPAGPVAANGTLDLQVTGRGGVPTSGVAAVLLNITVTEPTGGAGYLAAYPTGTPRPTTSNLNYATGQTIANAVTIALGTGGMVSLTSNRSTHIITDVFGYYLAGEVTMRGGFVPLPPARMFDTRTGSGNGFGAIGAIGAIGANETRSLSMLKNGVPAGWATAVVLNVTVTEPTGSGHLTVFASNTSGPATSNLNFAAGATVANQVTATLGLSGKVAFQPSVQTHVLADVTGYYLSP